VDSQKTSDLQRTYDDVAEEYVRRIYDELKDKPLDRQLLDRFAAAVGEKGIICDMGCGPGQVAKYLSERGATVIGVDLSQQMIEQARRLNPEIEFRQSNMLALDAEDEAWAGITAFYSIIHIPRDEVVSALLEFNRVLRPAGLLLLAFHIGEEVVHLDEWWERPVSVEFVFFQQDEMTAYLREAGFEVEEVIERPPYENVEHPSRRAYIFARKPA